MSNSTKHCTGHTFVWGGNGGRWGLGPEPISWGVFPDSDFCQVLMAGVHLVLLVFFLTMREEVARHVFLIGENYRLNGLYTSSLDVL